MTVKLYSGIKAKAQVIGNEHQSELPMFALLCAYSLDKSNDRENCKREKQGNGV